MAGESSDLKEEIARFRKWEAQLPAAARPGEWQEYPEWGALYTAFAGFIRQTRPAQWDEATVLDLLYIFARDNEAEYLVSLLSEVQPEGLFRLAEAAVRDGESDVRWQLAAYLGETGGDRSRAEAILLVLVKDEDEYVSRRALLALANLGSSHVPSLCERAWATGHEYQRIAALHAIQAASPRELPKYIELAKADGRQNLVQNAVKLEGY
ncbi:MAG: HEAT repeat domain-containing protein [Deltaproteobacteria bacterium]|nr:HEAT repeat domain-containing protein [Deltaproteobacteria bacterium]